MVKKLFALASVSALAGLVSAASVAGCTTTTTEAGPAADSGATDAKKDQTTKPPVEAGEDPPPAPTCLAKDPIDATKFPYVKPTVTKNACSADEAAAVAKFLDDHIKADDLNFTQSEWAASVSEDCAKCAFSELEADSWGVIINEGDAFSRYNYGGCIEVVSGKAACGKAFQQVINCQQAACGSCKTQDEADACQDDEGLATICEDAIKAVQTECGSSLNAYQTACSKGGLAGRINTQCVQGGAKGGDAGDGGDGG